MKTVKNRSVRGLRGLKPLQPEDNIYKMIKHRQKSSSPYGGCSSLGQGSYQAEVDVYSPRRGGLEEAGGPSSPGSSTHVKKSREEQ